MSGYPDSLLSRKLRGPMADWQVSDLLLRQILLAVQGGNWQRSGGKGSKPKPVPLPGEKAQKSAAKSSGSDIARRLQNLGQIPADVQV